MCVCANDDTHSFCWASFPSKTFCIQTSNDFKVEDVRLKRSFCVERRIGLCTMYIHIYEAHLQRKVSSGSLSTHCLKPFQCAHQKIHIRSITNASLRFYCHDVCPKLDRKLTYLENKNLWGKRIKRRECIVTQFILADGQVSHASSSNLFM